MICDDWRGEVIRGSKKKNKYIYIYIYIKRVYIHFKFGG